MVASSGAGNLREPFRVASGDLPGGVAFPDGVVVLGNRAVQVVPGAVPFDRDGEVPADVAACAVEVVPEVLPVLACGVVGVAHPVAEEVHSCEVVRADSVDLVDRVAGAEDPALACGHLDLPVVAREDRVDGADPVREPYGEALAVAPVEEAGTDCAAKGKGRDSATVVPSDSEPAAAASDCSLARDSPFHRFFTLFTDCTISQIFLRKTKKSQAAKSRKKMAADGKTSKHF